jgi:hypothetical protein
MTSPDLPENDLYVRAIKHAVAGALRWNRFKLRLLTLGLVLSLASLTGLGLVASQAYDTAAQLKRDSIINCNNNNAFRKASKQVLVHILNATLVGNRTPAALAFVKNQEAYIGEKYAPKDCVAIYSNVVGAPTKSPSPTTKAMSAYHETEALQSWNGKCLSFKGSPASGDALNYVACGSARVWQYYPVTGQLRPNANLNLAAGDVNGHPELVNASNTGASELNVANFEPGPLGYEYSTFYFAGHRNSDLYVSTGSTVVLNGFTGNAAHWVLVGGADRASPGSV